MPEVTPEAKAPVREETSYKERPLLFMLLLALVIVFNLLLGVLTLFLTPALPARYASLSWIFYLAGVLALLNAGFGIFLFRWKRWAFYGLCISAIIAFVLNLILGSDFITSLFGLLGPAILYLIIRSKWSLLE